MPGPTVRNTALNKIMEITALKELASQWEERVAERKQIIKQKRHQRLVSAHTELK